MTEERERYGAGKERKALSVEEFLEKWFPEDPMTEEMKKDLEEMLKEANEKGYDSGCADGLTYQ